MKSTQINFIGYLVALPISRRTSNFSPSIAILYKLLELSWFWQILFYTSVCETYSEAVKRAVVDHHTVWHGDWILCSSFILFSMISCHFFNLWCIRFKLFGIVIASFGFSFYCRQWQVVSCWNCISTPYLSISRLALVNACKL